MTTFAYRAGILAADTLVVDHSGSRVANAVKIAKRGPFLASAAGLHAFAVGFLDWFRAGLDPLKPPVMTGKAQHEWCVGVIFLPSGEVMRCVSEGWTRYVPLDGYYAGGTGADYALGAMAMGASAEEAVRIAMRFDTGTGGEVMTLRHDR